MLMVSHVPPVIGRLDFQSQFEQRWSDIDALGHANHLAYLRWCEDLRIEHAVASGLPPPGSGAFSQVVVELTAHYRAGLKRDDLVNAGLRIEKLGRTSMTVHLVIWQSQLCFEASTIVVLVDEKTQRPMPWPEKVRQTFEVCLKR